MFEEITHPGKRAFLTVYSESGMVKEAAAIAGVSRETHYDWRAHDPEYAAAFVIARKLAADALEDEAQLRARGLKSDKVLMFLLTHLMPETYGKKIEHNHDVTVKHTLDYSVFTDDELELLERLAFKVEAAGPPRDSGREGAETEEQALADVSCLGSFSPGAVPEAS